MIDRTASLLSSLAIAVLALTLTASLWGEQGRTHSHAPTLAPDPATCGCSPAPRPGLAPECIA